MAKSPIHFEWNKSKSIIIKDKGFGKAFYREVGEIFRREINPYVPYKSGALSNSVAIIAKENEVQIQYRSPYARRQYTGGGLSSESATGINDPSYWNRTLTPHPLATSYWDKAAWTNRKSVIGKQVNQARKKYAK